MECNGTQFTILMCLCACILAFALLMVVDKICVCVWCR